MKSTFSFSKTLKTFIDEPNILNIYLFGSSLYNTRNENSDYDYIVVCKELPGYGTLLNIGDETFHFHTLTNFQSLLDLNEIQALECMYCPYIYKIKENHVFSFDINKQNIRTSISTITSNSYVRGKKKLIIQGDYDKYLGIKSIFHSIRILDFAIQILTDGKIHNFESMNWILKDLLKISKDKESVELWELINNKYLSIYQSKGSIFRKLAPKNTNDKIIIDKKKLTISYNGEKYSFENNNDFKTIQKLLASINE